MNHILLVGKYDIFKISARSSTFLVQPYNLLRFEGHMTRYSAR